MFFTRARFEREVQRKRQVEVAKAIGCSVFELRMIELGRLTPTEKQRAALAELLGVSSDALLKQVIVREGAHVELGA